MTRVTAARQPRSVMEDCRTALALARPMLWGAELQQAVDTTLALPAGTVTFLLTDVEG